MCGEYCSNLTKLFCIGITLTCVGNTFFFFIVIPVGTTLTCVGNTLKRQKLIKDYRDHPHMRGEYLSGSIIFILDIIHLRNPHIITMREGTNEENIQFKHFDWFVLAQICQRLLGDLIGLKRQLPTPLIPRDPTGIADYCHIIMPKLIVLLSEYSQLHYGHEYGEYHSQDKSIHGLLTLIFHYSHHYRRYIHTRDTFEQCFSDQP